MHGASGCITFVIVQIFSSDSRFRLSGINLLLTVKTKGVSPKELS